MCVIASFCATCKRRLLPHYNRTSHPSMGATDIHVSASHRRYPAESLAALQASRIPVAASTCRRVGDDVGVEPNNCVTARHRQFGRSVTIGRHRNFVRHGSVHRGLRRGDRDDGRCEDEGMQMHGTISYGAPRQCGCPMRRAKHGHMVCLTLAGHPGRRRECHLDRRKRPSDFSSGQEAWPIVLS